jgi:hypothetical protein
MLRQREDLGLSRCGRQKDWQGEACRRAPLREPLLWEAGHIIQASFDDGQALAYAAQIILRAGRPSDTLLQNGHGNAVGPRRRLEEDSIRHGFFSPLVSSRSVSISSVASSHEGHKSQFPGGSGEGKHRITGR